MKLIQYLLRDNKVNKPIKFVIRKLGFYSSIYKIFEYLGLHDEISMGLIKKYIKTDSPVVLEIGCNVGQDTKRFLKSFKKIRLYCFEPDPRAIKQFKDNIDDSKCVLIEKAISNKTGISYFYLCSGIFKYSVGEDERHHLGSSSLNKRIKEHEVVKYNEKIKVQTVTLDSWVEENNIGMIDFVWADCEGAEKELIEGGINTLNNKVKYFYTEVLDNVYEGQPKLDELKLMLNNFRVIKSFGQNVLMENINLK